jgi:hypothetical protein
MQSGRVRDSQRQQSLISRKNHRRLMNHHHLHRILKDSVRAPLWLVNVRSIIERRVSFCRTVHDFFVGKQNKNGAHLLLNFERSATFRRTPRPTSQVSRSAFRSLVALVTGRPKKGGPPNNRTRTKPLLTAFSSFWSADQPPSWAGRMHGRLNMFWTQKSYLRNRKH